MSSGNLSFVQSLTDDKTSNDMINKAILLEIPFYSFKPLFMFDPQHALKGLRNALFNSTFDKYDLRTQCYPLQSADGAITVEDLRELFKHDTALYVSNRTLSSKNLWLDPWTKQSVKLILQVFNPIVLSKLKQMPEYKATTDFIDNACKLLIGTFVSPGKEYGKFDAVVSPKPAILKQVSDAFEFFRSLQDDNPDSCLHIKTYLCISSIRYGF
eukprot:50713_1